MRTSNDNQVNDVETYLSTSQLTDLQYRTLVENANDAILVAQDGKLAFYNQRTAEFTGYTADDLQRLPFASLIHPDDRAMVVERYRRRLTGEELPKVYTFRVVKKTGDDFWVEIRAVRIIWQDRPAILCFLTDISRYKIAESSLAESEQRYRNIVELSPYGIITLDVKGFVVSCNSAFVNLTGYQYDDFIGRHFSRIPTIRIKDVPHYVTVFANIIKNGFDTPVNFAWQHQDGTERWGEARGALVRSEGHITGFQAIIRDITEQRRAAELISALNQTALAVARATRAHDIYQVTGMELSKIGIDSAILTLSEDGKYLLPTYFSYNSHAVRMVERLLHKQVDVFKIDVAHVTVFREVIQRQKVILDRDPVLDFEQMFHGIPHAVASQIVNILKVKTSINAPLIIEERVIGLLSVQSDVLKQVDMPTIMAFANLLAAALHKAQLLEKTQSELEERRKAENEVHRLQHLLQNITDSMPSALISLDMEGKVLTVNPAAEKLLQQVNYKPQQPLWDIAPVFDCYQAMFKHVIHTGQAVTRHQEPIVLQEKVIYQDINAFPLVPGVLQGVVFRIDDVTEYVKLQELTLQSAKLASVGGLAAGVAHEINNPLAAMIQSAQMIQRSLDVDTDTTRERLADAGLDVDTLAAYLKERHFLEYVNGIREAGGRAAKIVTELLAFSRKNQSIMTDTDINSLIKKTVDLAATDYNLSNQYDFKNVSIDYHLDEQLPRVNCDPQQIQQVILNLLSNAAQTLVNKMQADTAFQPLIIITTGTEKRAVQIIVEDNGEGLHPATMGHIFEPFYTTKDVGVGTGLGLWLSWSIIVERHHGQLRAENRSDTGARFIIQLPIE